jgi:hypothetical protein
MALLAAPQARSQELLALVACGEASRQVSQQQIEFLQASSEPLYQSEAVLEARLAKLAWELAAANSRISDLLVGGGCCWLGGCI